MTKKLKSAILFLIHFLYFQSICAQTAPDMTDLLIKKFSSYVKSVPREEIFVHTDRDEYISGEELWFNTYLIDRQSFKPSMNSRIVYFELLNAVNRPVVQKRILIDKGFGPGQVVLPDTLSTGIYTIRAYTSWMKNFLPNNCFLKGITVYNTFNTRGFTGKKNAGTIVKNWSDNNLSEENINRGVTLKIIDSKSDILEIFIKADEKFRSENNKLFYIFIQTRGNINHVGIETMNQETTLVSIPKAELSNGINQITIFNSKGEPVAEKFHYTYVKENSLLKIHANDSCNLRDKITLEIDQGNVASEALYSSNMSISVAPEPFEPETMDIDDYMVFGTEYGKLHRSIINGRKINELPLNVIDSILTNLRSNWIDWKIILSDDQPHFKYQMEKEDHFLLGKIVSNDQQAVHSSELLFLCTPGKEALFQYARTDSEGNFRFNIHIDEGLKDLMIIPEDEGTNHKIVVESSFSDRYLQSELSVDSSSESVPANISKLSVNHQVQKIYERSATGPPSKQAFEPPIPVRFYGKPDIELILGDYISLPVMNEIFFELLQGVYLKEKRSGYEISIAGHVGDNLFVTYPSLMIDGVLIKDPSLIVNLDPEIVEKIDVIKEKYLVGKYFFPGIINVITKSGDFTCVSIPDYMIRLTYRVIDPVWSFVSPDYSSEEMKESRIPDYRNTLYWNPSVKPGNDGKTRIEFWSSDNKSGYEINIQGITVEGKAISLKKIIKVK
jgi:hypothetical protein